MRRRAVDVKVALLHVFAVVAFLIGQAEEPLLQDRVAAVPKRQRETQPALTIANPQQPVLAPAISAAAGVIVGKIIPAIAAGRIILAHGAPLAFRKIGT